MTNKVDNTEEILKELETVEEAQEETVEEQTTESENTEATGETAQEAQQTQEEDADARYVRLMADFQNYKRRSEKEKSDIYAYANEKIVMELLEVMDNFDRALEAAGKQDANEGFVSGMEMIFKQLKGVLEKNAVAEIEALGVDFDPNFHNAVMMEDSEEYESGKVTCVLQKGYSLNGKVIRPSMVKVAN